jgi:hypothetical protein
LFEPALDHFGVIIEEGGLGEEKKEISQEVINK